MARSSAASPGVHPLLEGVVLDPPTSACACPFSGPLLMPFHTPSSTSHTSQRKPPRSAREPPAWTTLHCAAPPGPLTRQLKPADASHSGRDCLCLSDTCNRAASLGKNEQFARCVSSLFAVLGGHGPAWMAQTPRGAPPGKPPRGALICIPGLAPIQASEAPSGHKMSAG